MSLFQIVMSLGMLGGMVAVFWFASRQVEARAVVPNRPEDVADELVEAFSEWCTATESVLFLNALRFHGHEMAQALDAFPGVREHYKTPYAKYQWVLRQVRNLQGRDVRGAVLH